jgi:hypothetical protein
VALGATEDAKKKRYDAEAVKAVLKGVEVIVSMMGKKLVRLNLKKDKPSRTRFTRRFWDRSGRSGPRRCGGKTLIVGFNPETYEQLFK